MDKPNHPDIEPIYYDIYDRYFDVSHQELILGRLIDRWSRIDLGIRLIIALTASGSAVAGWTLWETEGAKEYWAAVSGLAAVLAIVHSTIKISDLVEKGKIAHTMAWDLRMQFEKLMRDYRRSPNQELGQFADRLDGLNEKASALFEQSPHFPDLTDGFKKKAHYDVIEILKARNIIPSDDEESGATPAARKLEKTDDQS